MMNSSPVLSALLFPVIRRRKSGKLFEVLAEEVRIAVAALAGDFLDGFIRVHQSPFGLVDAFPSQPVNRTGPHGAFEGADEVAHTHAGEIGKLGEFQRISIMLFHADERRLQGARYRLVILSAILKAAFVKSGEQSGNRPVHVDRGMRAGDFEEVEGFEEKRLQLCVIQTLENRGFPDTQQFGQGIESGAIHTHPVHFPGIRGIGIVFVGMPAGGPAQTVCFDPVNPSRHLDHARTFQAVDQFVSFQRVSLDVMCFVRHQMPRPERGVERTTNAVALGVEITAEKFNHRDDNTVGDRESSKKSTVPPGSPTSLGRIAVLRDIPAMPDPIPPPLPPEDKSHDSTIANVVRHEADIDKKMAGQKAFKALLQNGRLLLQMVKDYFKGNYREVPYWAIGAAALALFYVFSPLDAIPDLVPGLGYLDDATVLAFCLKLVETELEKYRQWRKARGLDG